MYDILNAYMTSQEIDRKVRERREVQDPTSLYRYEMSESIGVLPGLKALLVSAISRFRRSNPPAKQGIEAEHCMAACSSHSLQQSWK